MFYTLHNRDNNEYLGVYTSIGHCSKALNTYLDGLDDEHKSFTLYYVAWEPNSLEPDHWEWAYISPNATVEDLKKSSDYIPAQGYWGENIIEVEWEEIEG